MPSRPDAVSKEQSQVPLPQVRERTGSAVVHGPVCPAELYLESTQHTAHVAQYITGGKYTDTYRLHNTDILLDQAVLRTPYSVHSTQYTVGAGVGVVLGTRHSVQMTTLLVLPTVGVEDCVT